MGMMVAAAKIEKMAGKLYPELSEVAMPSPDAVPRLPRAINIAKPNALFFEATTFMARVRKHTS